MAKDAHPEGTTPMNTTPRPVSGDFEPVYTWDVMTPRGWNDSPVTALTLDLARAIVARRGHTVVADE